MNPITLNNRQMAALDLTSRALVLMLGKPDVLLLNPEILEQRNGDSEYWMTIETDVLGEPGRFTAYIDFLGELPDGRPQLAKPKFCVVNSETGAGANFGAEWRDDGVTIERRPLRLKPGTPA